MKKRVLSLAVIVCLLFNVNLQAQKTTISTQKILKSTVFEAGIGHQLILSPKAEGFNKFGAFHLGARMTIKDNFGVRGFFQQNNFSKGNQGVKINKLVGEGTYKWNVKTRKSPLSNFSILAHAGIGFGISNSQVPTISQTEKIGIVQIGFMPEYKINDVFGVFIDLTYTANISQNYLFNGSFNNDNSTFTGQLFIPSFGISIKPFR